MSYGGQKQWEQQERQQQQASAVSYPNRRTHQHQQQQQQQQQQQLDLPQPHTSTSVVSRFNSSSQQQQQQQRRRQQDSRIHSLSTTTVPPSSVPSNVAVDSLPAVASPARFNNSNSLRLHPHPHPHTHDSALDEAASPSTSLSPRQQRQNHPRPQAYRAVSAVEDIPQSSYYYQTSAFRHSHPSDAPLDPPDYDSSQQRHRPPAPDQVPAPPQHRSSSYQPPRTSPPPPTAYQQDPQVPSDQRIPSYDSTSPQERARQLGYTNSIRTNSTTTPGADNLGETAAGGGIAGIAYGVANANERDSGLQALRAIGQGNRKSIPGGRREDMDRAREDNPYVPEPRGYYRRDSGPPAAARGAVRDPHSGGAAGASAAVTGGYGGSVAAGQAQRHYEAPQQTYGYYSEAAHDTGYGSYEAYRPQGHHVDSMQRGNLTPQHHPEDPFGSRASLAPSYPDDAFAGGFTPPRRQSHIPPGAGAAAAAGAGAGFAAGAMQHAGPYSDSPYQRRSHLMEDGFEHFNPNDIADDGDDYPVPPQHGRRSALGMGGANRSASNMGAAPMGAAAGAGLGAGLGGLASRDVSGKYTPVAQTAEFNPANEKNEDLSDQKKRKRRMIIGIVVLVVLVIAGIVGGAVGGILGSRKNSSASQPSNSADPDSAGLLNANSASIKALMNNPNLHRVFPGMAYTPLNAQYPACLSNPVSQNNVTKDVAVLSQLTNVIRLYGTDCNQTEMVIEAMQQLNIKDMKLWVAVWLDNNATTNARGLSEMQSLLQKYGKDGYFKGVILGNEVLFRKDLTAAQLTSIIDDTRRNLTASGVQLPLAVADLGDNWTADLAAQVDTVMSNVHPFFAGVPADQGAAWAWNFWQTHDVVLTANNQSKENIISEIGWPTGGGNDCGSDTVKCTSSTAGAVAGIAEMNTFMDSFVCQSLKNGTNYFMFEAFDEPWKVQFNTPGMEWEDKWGLFDSNRNLKKGVQIPSCPGQSIPAA